MLRRLLLLLMVPVVLVAQTGAAEAAEEIAFSDPTDFVLELSERDASVRQGPWLDCNGAASYEVKQESLPGLPPGEPAAIIFGNLDCHIEHGWASDPDAGDLHDNDWTLTFHGKLDGVGAECGTSDHTNGDIVNGWPFRTSVAIVHECQIDEVCLQGQVTREWPGVPDATWYFEGCALAAMGQQPEIDPGRGTCEFGDPTDIYTESAPADPPFEPHYGHDIQAWFTRPGNVTHKGWLFDARYSTVTGGNTPGTKVWRNGSFNESPPRTWTIDGNLAWWRQNMPAGSGNLYQNTDRGAEDAVGVWVWATDPAAPGDQANWRTANGLKIINEYTYGDTDPGNCVFYFGPKFRDDPNTLLDEPWGSIETDLGSSPPPDTSVEPAPDRGGCDFDFGDPSTWAGAGICALVNLFLELIDLVEDVVDGLAALLEAVLDLAADILAGLFDLFVPDPDAWGLEDLKAQLDTKPPFSLVGPLGDQVASFASAYTSSGSCGTLATFSIPGTDASLDCAAIKNAPGMGGLYNLVSFALVSLTAWGCFRIVSGLFEDGQ